MARRSVVALVVAILVLMGPVRAAAQSVLEVQIATSTSQSAPGFGRGANPGNTTLAGGWRDERDISDAIALDDQGFFKTGNDEWGYTSVGTYTFDGGVITVTMHRAEGADYAAGETYRFPVSNVSSSGFNIEKGDYETRYVPHPAYRVTEDDRDSVRAIFNHDALKNTWWESGGESELYRNYVLLTQDARMQALLGITQGMGIIDVIWRH